MEHFQALYHKLIKLGLIQQQLPKAKIAGHQGPAFPLDLVG